MSDQPQFLKKTHATIVHELLSDLADPSGGRVALTDASEGSVVRTLVEAFARALAVAYEQIGAVYRLGYLESADGKSLDHVVALVGLRRQPGGHAEGLLRLSRTTPAPADIRVPAGTLVAGRGVPPVETLADAVLSAGARVVLVRAASVEPTRDPIAANALDQLVRPIHGIDAVTNPGELPVAPEPETDPELRARARFSLRRGQLGTCDGIAAAVRGLGVRSVRVAEQQPERPGRVDVIVGDTDLHPDTIAALEDAIDDARPAGVRVTLRVAEAVPVIIVVKPILARPAVADDETRIRNELAAQIRGYLEALDPDEPVVLAKLRALVQNHPEIRKLPDDPGALVLSTTRAGILKNPDGDLTFDGGKRAALGRIDVLLQPPVVDLWIDAVLAAKPGAPPPDELRAAITRALAERMDREATTHLQHARELGFDDLKAMLPPFILAELLHLRSTRSTTGQSLLLAPGSATLRLKPQERLTLRSVEVNGV